ncbi:MAG: prephenate dehydrogenase [Ignavibacteriales bacterium]|nr:MAG: prephenate dehydrogenase [Ignavibacteriaceae bacterium]MBW7873389.1 prephenate dehydrogenase [Ignavibacteria bacterium]MCZ2142079.1 prephenate dehydrogenase [Ignavibacteriales bacterium]OQY71651.1 MAG: prephenate dehydrogenase [Ignavibacteriales bacterium UTCHB3]MBV6444817.1 Cyclohexadienyl dehydrogenase [Ignavibacteriaceae bacterium]
MTNLHTEKQTGEKTTKTPEKQTGRTATIIGIGLIGGSLALDLKDSGFCSHITGVEANPEHAAEAKKLGLVDEILPLKDAVKKSELVIIAVPVDATIPVLKAVLDETENQIITDVGSTKEKIAKSVKGHPRRGRFVPSHPIWGTEFSGPSAAVRGGFSGNVTVICDKNECDPDSLAGIEAMYDAIGMKKIYMDSVSHDVHAAYVSHISHATSFSLALSVLEKEKEVDTIFQLAGAGFESTVRLAKSNPETWVPIFMENRENLLDVLEEQIERLLEMKECLRHNDTKRLKSLMKKANEIKKVLKK